MKLAFENSTDLSPSDSAGSLFGFRPKVPRPIPRSIAPFGGYMPVLDGLRGIAILSVMTFHFWMFGTTAGMTLSERVYSFIASKGWVGVDLFFVLSGFLITGILYDSRKDPHYFRVFYARRTVRIFPLYYASLALVFCIVPFLLSALQMEFTGAQDGAAAKIFAWSYLLNWYEGLKGFSAVSLPLQHFWSLAIEEQFYLVWPFLVLMMARRRLMGFCIALMALAFVLRVALFNFHLPEAAYTWTFCRTDSLVVGALVALASRDPHDWKRAVKLASRVALPALVAALALIKLHILSPESGSPHYLLRSFGFSLLGIAFGGFLVMAIGLRDGSFAHRLLGSPFLRFFGKYSYCLYICHQPLIAHFAKLGLHAEKLAGPLHHRWLAIVAVNGISFAGAVAIALVSWHLFEKHFLKLKEIPMFQHEHKRVGRR